MSSIHSFVAEQGTDCSFEFRSLVVSHLLTKSSPSLDDFNSLLSTCLNLSEPSRTLCTLNTIQDVLESITPDQCETLFSVVERLWSEIAEMVTSSKMQNSFLCFLNELHKIAVHETFKYRISQFCWKILPPFHKSSQNVKGTIAPASCGVTENEQDLSEFLQEVQEASKNLMLDYDLYVKFWRLQECISKGMLCLETSEQFVTMTSSMESVLSAIQSSLKSTASSVSFAPQHEGLDLWTRYPKDPELLLAQFSPEFDKSNLFKAQVLVQMSVFLFHLARYPKIEAKQASQVKGFSKRITSELRKLFGSKLINDIESVDTAWFQWRSEGAKVSELPKEIQNEELGNQSQNQEDMLSKKSGFGNVELTRLWEQGGTFLLDQDEGKLVTQPRFDSFLERALEENDPENDIEEQYQIKNNAVFQWKTLRSTLDQKLQLFDVPNPVELVTDVLKLAKKEKNIEDKEKEEEEQEEQEEQEKIEDEAKDEEKEEELVEGVSESKIDSKRHRSDNDNDIEKLDEEADVSKKAKNNED